MTQVRRIAVTALIWLLAARPAVAACALNATGSSDLPTIGATSISTLSPMTTTVPTIVMVWANNWQSGPAYAVVSSVVGAGLTWSRRRQVQFTSPSSGTNGCFGTGAPCFIDNEEWTAAATAPFAGQTVTINFSAGVLAGTLLVTAFGGTSGPDPAAGLPAVMFNDSGPQSQPTVAGVSTASSPDTLLLWCEYNTVPGSFCSPPTGWAAVGGVTNYQPFNARFVSTSISSLVVAAPQSGASFSALGSPTSSWMMLADALTCGGPPSVQAPFVWIHE